MEAGTSCRDEVQPDTAQSVLIDALNFDHIPSGPPAKTRAVLAPAAAAVGNHRHADIFPVASQGLLNNNYNNSHINNVVKANNNNDVSAFAAAVDQQQQQQHDPSRRFSLSSSSSDMSSSMLLQFPAKRDRCELDGGGGGEPGPAAVTSGAGGQDQQPQQQSRMQKQCFGSYGLVNFRSAVESNKAAVVVGNRPASSSSSASTEPTVTGSGVVAGGGSAGKKKKILTTTTSSSSALQLLGGGGGSSSSGHKVSYTSKSNLSLPDLRAQVGGHKVIKVYGDKYVCKPLDRRECAFYRTFPSTLEPFIPRFCGILSVNSYDARSDYIMMENLTTGYVKPCVLDLKMGTRMYGDFATEKKRKSQDYKVKQSTSSKLGVRLCGFQRYSRSNRTFQRVDKYVGRKVDVAKFEELLQNFFTVGGEVQAAVVRHLIRQAKDLREVIGELVNYRFYSSSLLIVFEGEIEDQHHQSREVNEDLDLEKSFGCFTTSDPTSSTSVQKKASSSSSSGATSSSFSSSASSSSSSSASSSSSTACASYNRHFGRRSSLTTLLVDDDRRRRRRRRLSSCSLVGEDESDAGRRLPLSAVDRRRRRPGGQKSSSSAVVGPHHQEDSRGCYEDQSDEEEEELDVDDDDVDEGRGRQQRSSNSRVAAASGVKSPILKLIDFANVTSPEFISATEVVEAGEAAERSSASGSVSAASSSSSCIHEGPDRGFLFGLNNLIHILENILERAF